jgi:hypothetical protein
VLSRSLQPHATLEAIASIVVPGIADWCRVDLVDARAGCSARSRITRTRRSRGLVPSWCSGCVPRRTRPARGVDRRDWTSHLAHFDPARGSADP